MMSLNSPNESKFPRSISDWKWMKTTEGGREQKRGIERGEEVWKGGTGRTRTYTFQKKHFFINKQLPFFVTIVSVYRVEIVEKPG